MVRCATIKNRKRVDMTKKNKQKTPTDKRRRWFRRFKGGY